MLGPWIWAVALNLIRPEDKDRFKKWVRTLSPSMGRVVINVYPKYLRAHSTGFAFNYKLATEGDGGFGRGRMEVCFRK